MLLKRSGLILLILAYLTTLGHAFIPHQHHSDHHELADHHNGAHHHHDEIPSDAPGVIFTHLLHGDIVYTPSTSIEFKQLASELPIFFSAFLIADCLSIESPVKQDFFGPPPEPFLRKTPFISQSGFRAPPTSRAC